MNRLIPLVLAVIALWLAASGMFTVQESEQVIITQFGQPVGNPIVTAGLHFKTPFIQDTHFLDKRVLEWDGPNTETPTRDKLYIVVNAFAALADQGPAAVLPPHARHSQRAVAAG